MKKLFATVILLVFGFGYSAWGDPVGFGIHAGATMANQVFPPSAPSTQIQPDVLFGMTGGVFAEFGLSDFLSLQPEADFTMKGRTINLKNIILTGPGEPLFPPFPTANATYTYNFNYLEFPLFLKAHTALSPHVTGSLSVGPALSVLLTAFEHYLIETLAPGNSPLTANTLEGSALFGAGLELDRFLIDLRYDLGLTSVYPNYPNGPRNSTLSLQLGYRLQ
jgi:hypothetical protein